jgi:thioredoxin 2
VHGQGLKAVLDASSPERSFLVQAIMMQTSTARSAGPVLACPACHALVRVPPDRLADTPKCPRCKSEVVTGRPVELTQASFAAHTERATLPVLVDFWAEWCGPCKMMAPVLEQLAARRRLMLQVAKVDTDAEQALAARFGIRSIPTLILLVEGRELARQSGAMPLAALEQWLERTLPH